ncbi:MAG: hypothetical protein JO359_07350 [Candidatus Eremiobacteraeota bacterium]|nr:hypothetical protein [Candidatus Eremiobacteraeota bacterium]
MNTSLALALGTLAVAVAFVACGRKALLAWFLREAEGLEETERTAEPIKTYPMF